MMPPSNTRLSPSLWLDAMRQPGLVVVGDVHGQAERLEKALDAYAEIAQPLVFVGDYVNRGPGSRRVLDLLCDAKRLMGEALVLLRGNHDQILLDFLDGGDLSRLAAHGGLATIRSYLSSIDDKALERFVRDFPVNHRELLTNTRSYYETEDVLVSHVGFNPHFPNSRSSDDMFMSGHHDLFQHQGPWPRPVTVCGHYVQADGHPAISGQLRCIDTGCGTLADAPLTALEVAELRIVQFR